MKTIDVKQPSLHKYIKTEIEIMNKVKGHPNFVQIISSRQENDTYELLLEYCEVSDTTSFLK